MAGLIIDFREKRAEMITGLGIDLVDIDRITKVLQRTPNIVEKFNMERKREVTPTDLAQNIAVLEALYKALPIEERREIRKYRLSHNLEGAPTIERLNIGNTWENQEKIRVSVTHEGNSLIAIVIIES
jgi:holo-[acyl-carrier protein] synthase